MRGTSVTMGMYPMTECVGVDAAVPGPVDQWQQVGGEAATIQDGFVGGHHLDRDRPLVRVHPDHDGREQPM